MPTIDDVFRAFALATIREALDAATDPEAPARPANMSTAVTRRLVRLENIVEALADDALADDALADAAGAAYEAILARTFGEASAVPGHVARGWAALSAATGAPTEPCPAPTEPPCYGPCGACDVCPALGGES